MHFIFSCIIVLLATRSVPVHGLRDWFNETEGEIVIPLDQGIVGETLFNYTDTSKENENVAFGNSSTVDPGPVEDPNLPGKLMQILSPDGKSLVFTTTGGNLHMKSTSDAGDISDRSPFFYGDANTGRIFSDQSERLFHYYSQTMTSYGVSRLRLHNTTSIPNTAKLVILVPLATPNHPTGAKSLLVAANAKNQYYYIAACNLKGQYTKLFLFKKYPQGLTALKSQAMRSVVTGGEVEDCALVALTNGAAGYSA